MKTSAKVLLTLLIVISSGKGLISLISAWRGKDDAIPIETRLHKNKLTIISKTDNIEIQNIQFNRGNCSHTSKDLKDLEDLEEGVPELFEELDRDKESIADNEKTIQEYQNEIANFQKYYKDVKDIDDYSALMAQNEHKDSYTWDNDLDFESLKKSLLSSIEHSIEEWQNKVKELLDENKSALAEMNEINEQLPQVQKKLQELTDKKTAMFTLKFGESLTTEHDCKNLMEVKIQTDKGSKTLHLKLPQPKEEGY
ncbi:hypothetical protein [Helicobacter pylori]|uniref:hypothetical protein n=1 Tax=Helicobacter pylori TaxID=210 RepID=UPI001F099F9B|nr:hypothetical protein [Helicobacter pylori]